MQEKNGTTKSGSGSRQPEEPPLPGTSDGTNPGVPIPVFQTQSDAKLLFSPDCTGPLTSHLREPFATCSPSWEELMVAGARSDVATTPAGPAPTPVASVDPPVTPPRQAGPPQPPDSPRGVRQSWKRLSNRARTILKIEGLVISAMAIAVVLAAPSRWDPEEGRLVVASEGESRAGSRRRTPVGRSGERLWIRARSDHNPARPEGAETVRPRQSQPRAR
jgi:hypothetical protein